MRALKIISCQIFGGLKVSEIMHFLWKIIKAYNATGYISSSAAKGRVMVFLASFSLIIIAMEYYRFYVANSVG